MVSEANKGGHDMFLLSVWGAAPPSLPDQIDKEQKGVELLPGMGRT
jgi:hypothetical protein